jgi:hypothetical protein
MYRHDLEELHLFSGALNTFSARKRLKLEMPNLEIGRAEKFDFYVILIFHKLAI